MVNSRSNRFVWYELLTTDVKAARGFYTDVVGWRARDVSMPGSAYSLFTFEDAPITGMMNLPEATRRAGATPCWMGYISVDDVDVAVDRIRQLGGAVRVPPTDIPNVSRFSIIADPQQATLALVKGRKPSQAQSAELSTAPGRVGWHELFAADWETAFVFYSSLFGWKKKHTDVSPMGTYQQFSTGGETIGGMSNKPPTLLIPFWLYYFNISDIAAAAERVTAGGGQILYGPMEVPGGAWIAHCADPQGALFGLLDRPKRKVVGYVVASPEPSDTPGRP